MTTSQEVVITDDMRAPDERVKVNPFRHPWIKGTDIDPECGRTWHDHGWIDRGDHGFTVCPTEAERPDVVEERLAKEWDEGMAVGAEFGADAPYLNPLHANPYRADRFRDLHEALADEAVARGE